MCLNLLLEFSEGNDIAEEEQVPVLGLWAFRDLNALIQQQLPILTGEAEDEGALLHWHPAGSFLPEDSQTKWRLVEGGVLVILDQKRE